MVGKGIYTNCGTVGLTKWPDREAGRSNEGGPQYPMDEQGRRTPGRVPNGGWTGARRRGTGARQRRIGVRRRAHRCPTESRSGPTEGGVSGGGPTAGLGVAQQGTI
jgi:hypothetical protein